MSTSGFIGFRINGIIKGTYNHLDSYPSELGNDIVEFIRIVVKGGKIKGLKDKLSKVKFVDQNSTPTHKQIVKYFKFSNIQVGSQNLEDWYVLLRNVQGIKTLKYIMSNELHHIIDNTNFLSDTIMCEYGYVLNFDNSSIEFYDMGEIVGELSFKSLVEDKTHAGTKWIKIIYDQN
jgi:hypothetical protein